MTDITAALATGRDRLVTALWDHPEIREALSHAQIVTVVDTAFAAMALPALLEGVVAAEAVVAAVMADVTSPPPSVTGAIGSYVPTKEAIGDRWEVYDEP
ncbi:MAG: hypothetical protein DI570_09340 [Phenylobacterium zucineum]|nr:MAG: hypothetical protein DI570_09340 [Phenylobacterium zucineum]